MLLGNIRSGKRSVWWLLATITLTALFLGLYRYNADSLWFDESLTCNHTRASWSGFLNSVVAAEQMPPLYFVLMKLWTGLAGDSEFALRLPSLLCGVLTVPLLGWFLWRLEGPEVGCMGALLLACSPFHIWYSQEARAYACLRRCGTPTPRGTTWPDEHTASFCRHPDSDEGHVSNLALGVAQRSAACE